MPRLDKRSGIEAIVAVLEDGRTRQLDELTILREVRRIINEREDALLAEMEGGGPPCCDRYFGEDFDLAHTAMLTGWFRCDTCGRTWDYVDMDDYPKIGRQVWRERKQRKGAPRKVGDKGRM